MADDRIKLRDVDGNIVYLDADSLSIAGFTVLRERDRIAGRLAAELLDVRGTDPTLGDYGAVVRLLDVVSPVRDYLNSPSLAAGASVNLDGTTIAAAKTGKLMAARVSSSAPCKWIIKSRDGAVELTFGVLFTGLHGSDCNAPWATPDKRFTTLLGNGIDENFRVTVTNLDQENAADVHATLLWDEV